MKGSVLSVAAFGASAMAATVNTLTATVQKLPSCAMSDLKAAMDTAGCSTSDIGDSTFNCMCNLNLVAIGTAVLMANSDLTCQSQFAYNYGYMCGTYLNDVSSSDLSSASSLLESDLSGSAGSDSGDTTSSASGSAMTTSTPASSTGLPGLTEPSASTSTPSMTSDSGSGSDTTPTPSTAGSVTPGAAAPLATIGFLVPAVAFGALFL